MSLERASIWLHSGQRWGVRCMALPPWRAGQAYGSNIAQIIEVFNDRALSSTSAA
jgi:hypothetical protein